jgi:hypothetical protein
MPFKSIRTQTPEERELRAKKAVLSLRFLALRDDAPKRVPKKAVCA